MKTIFKLGDYMERNSNYNTKQKELIRDIIKKQNKEFTIKDIYDDIKGSVGLTTVYRLVDKLVIDGVLNKTISSDNIAYYQYLEKCDNENHFYLRCDKCGDMIHVDCDCIEELSDHIKNEHKFRLNREKVIINGICNKCIGKE